MFQFWEKTLNSRSSHIVNDKLITSYFQYLWKKSTKYPINICHFGYWLGIINYNNFYQRSTQALALISSDQIWRFHFPSRPALQGLLSLHGIKGHEWLKGYRFMHKIVIKQKNIITTTWKLRVYQENEIKEKYFLSLIRRVYDKVFGEWSNALFDTKKCVCTKGPNN